MRRLNTSTFLIIALFLIHPAHADTNAESAAASPAVNEPARPAGETNPGSAETAPPPAPDRRVAQPTREEICRIIEAAATREALPVPFFARLIWRESRFDPRAVSPAGAQGIAQFMPFVANGRGLADPFDPLSALLESAEYLGELLRRFGNVGLAAAAYNAGPKRVQDWLAKRGGLRQETRDYVAIITGHGPRAWVAGAPADATEAAEDFRCAEIHKIARRRPPASDAPGSAETAGRAKAEPDAAARRHARATHVASTAKMAEQRRRASDAKRKEADSSRKHQAAAKRGGVKVVALSTSRRSSKVPARENRSNARATASRGSPPHRVRVADNRRATVGKACAAAKGSGRKECRST
jgi:Transglycosylase SLT domain